MTAIAALLPFTAEEAIEDAIASGDMALHTSARLAAAQAKAEAHAESLYFWAQQEYDYRVCGSEYDQWVWDHFYAP